ncbi:MAG: cytochrome C [SAR324 cluster bacterium]|nr:cytochrome C [SAR324 cluster bacterium]
MTKKLFSGLFLSIVISFVAAVSWAADLPKVTASTETDAGRYLVKIGGCNDCHTPMYAPKAGKVPESDWLVGDILGYRGPWGTTYPTNLRLYFQEISEDEWVNNKVFKKAKPPMPWFNLMAMSDQDLRAIYRYIKSLGAKGGKAPAYLPPDQNPNPPFIQWPAPPPQ